MIAHKSQPIIILGITLSQATMANNYPSFTSSEDSSYDEAFDESIESYGSQDEDGLSIEEPLDFTGFMDNIPLSSTRLVFLNQLLNRSSMATPTPMDTSGVDMAPREAIPSG